MALGLWALSLNSQNAKRRWECLFLRIDNFIDKDEEKESEEMDGKMVLVLDGCEKTFCMF